MTMAIKKPARTLADFAAEYNPDVRIPAAIKSALASLREEGPEAWEYDMDFVRRCGPGVGNTNMSNYRGQFEKHQVKVRIKGKNEKIVWFADIKVAAKARGE
jgi:hypothetical protein